MKMIKTLEVISQLMQLLSDNEEIYSALSEAEDAIINSDKYRWHDLLKNPEDLPEYEDRVLVATHTKNGLINYVLGYYTSVGYSGRWVCGMNSNVVAWRKIEPFKVEK